MPEQVNKIEPATDEHIAELKKEAQQVLEHDELYHGEAVEQLKLIARIENDRERIRADHPAILAAIKALQEHRGYYGTIIYPRLGTMMVKALKGLEGLGVTVR